MTEYQELNSTTTLEAALATSAQRPALFFKHSTTCGISARAFSEFQKYLETPVSAEVDNYVIIIQDARAVSQELAQRTGIEHESPQAIIVQAGAVVWNESHMKLKRDLLVETVQQTVGQAA